MTETRTTGTHAKPPNSLGALLRSWWSGADADAGPARAAGAPKPADARAGDDTPVDPLAIAQQLWGPGFLLPGGPSHILSLVKPFDVNPAMSLLDLSAGLGGPSRQVSQAFDVYISGFERSPTLAQRGHAMSIEAGLARKVPITPYDPETMKLRARAYDCTYAQFLTWQVADKVRLFREIRSSLKPGGQLTFTDFVLEQANEDDPALARLREVEPYPVVPWRRLQYLQALQQVGMDCRIAQDMTEQFRAEVIEGWSSLVKTTDLRHAPKRYLLAVLDQAELWVRRLTALERGVLGVYRFYAITTSASG